jgi:hypothetical protein
MYRKIETDLQVTLKEVSSAISYNKQMSNSSVQAIKQLIYIVNSTKHGSCLRS